MLLPLSTLENCETNYIVHLQHSLPPLKTCLRFLDDSIRMRLLIAILSSLLATAQLVTSSRHFKRNTTAPYQLQEGPLDTDWTKEVGTDPWPEYPRPQLQRSEWQNLNGVWQYQQASNASDKDHPPFDTDLAKSVLVPFCLESALSGGCCTFSIAYKIT